MRPFERRCQRRDVFVGGQGLPYVGQDLLGGDLPLVIELADRLENLPASRFQVALQLCGLLQHSPIAASLVATSARASNPMTLAGSAADHESHELLRGQGRLHPVCALGGKSHAGHALVELLAISIAGPPGPVGVLLDLGREGAHVACTQQLMARHPEDAPGTLTAGSQTSAAGRFTVRSSQSSGSLCSVICSSGPPWR